MDPHFEQVETDSTVDCNVGVLDTTDPDVEFRTHAWDDNAGQVLAGRAGAVTVGLRTDVDTRQAADPNVGHFAMGFAPRGYPAATHPAWLQRPALTGTEQPTQRLIHLRSRTRVRFRRHLEPHM